MRILLPSATLAAFTSAFTLVSATNEATAFHNEQQPTNDATISQVARDVNKSYHDSYYYTNSNNNLRRQQRECNTHEQRASVGTDVGVLGCHGGEDEICVPDESSKLGGRCTTTTDVNTNRHSAVFINSYNGASSTDTRSSSTIDFGRDAQPSSSASLHLRSRSLQSYTFNCPTSCSQSFCNCIQSTFDGIDFLQDKSCASEIANVCTTTETLAACGITDDTNYYIGFVTEGLCPYAECLVKVQEGDKMEEECFCEYYR